MKRVILIFLVVVVTNSIFVTGMSMDYTESINTKQLEEMLNKDDQITVIDVREPMEYIIEHIPNSILFPVDSIITNFMILDKTKEYIVLCSSGGRSRLVSKFLVNKGFGNVVNVLGGIREFEGEKISLIRQMEFGNTYYQETTSYLEKSLEDIDGNTINISNMAQEKPVILFYYRNNP